MTTLRIEIDAFVVDDETTDIDALVDEIEHASAPGTLTLNVGGFSFRATLVAVYPPED